MASTRFETAVIVTRKTELDELVARFVTAPQARFYLEHAGQDFDHIQGSLEQSANVAAEGHEMPYYRSRLASSADVWRR